ncbi:MAG: hypothetical protein Kow00129_14580 [Thermoleophilia bacterium]
MTSAPKPRPVSSLRRRVEAFLARSQDDPAHSDPGRVHQLVRELAEHQAELERRNEELQKTHSALEEVRDVFTALYEYAPAGFVVLDTTGTIRRTNAAFRRMVEFEDQDLIGGSLLELMTEEDAAQFAKGLRSFLRYPADRQMVVRMHRRSGSTFSAQIKAGPFVPGPPEETSAGSPPAKVMVAVTDVSDLYEAQSRIERQRQELLAAKQREERLNAELRSSEEFQ